MELLNPSAMVAPPAGPIGVLGEGACLQSESEPARANPARVPSESPAPGAALPEFPPDAVRLPERLQQCVDRKLGYFGSNRWVFFYFESRGHEVVWNDGRSYGFSCGGWMAFEDEVLPLAGRHAAEVGGDHSRARDVLLVDRTTGDLYFADRLGAERFVRQQAVRKTA